MREIPLMHANAVQAQKEIKANLKGIVEKVEQGAKNFAAKPFNRRGLKVDLSQIKPLQGYDGTIDHTEGKVTFKFKTERTFRKQRSEKQNLQQLEKLTSDEIKSICNEN